MNRIYKVIWSRVKHCYVVVSELTKSAGKGNISAQRKKLSSSAFSETLRDEREKTHDRSKNFCSLPFSQQIKRNLHQKRLLFKTNDYLCK